MTDVILLDVFNSVLHPCAFSYRAEGAEQLADHSRHDDADQGAEGRVRRLQSSTGQNQIGHRSRHARGAREGPVDPFNTRSNGVKTDGEFI